MHKLIYAEAEGREPRILPCVNVRLAPELPSISAGGKESQAIRARSINLNVTNQWHTRANRCGATRYRAALSNTPSKTDCGIYNVTLHRQRPLAPCLSGIRHEEKLQRDGSEWQSCGGLLRKKKKKQKMKSVRLHSASAQTEADSADQSHASSHLRPDLSARRVGTCRSSLANFTTTCFWLLSALLH